MMRAAAWWLHILLRCLSGKFCFFAYPPTGCEL
jgi:hypothetical protein